MKEEQEYIKDLTEIRSMMERSTRFLSLTGWSGIMAGIYALVGAYLAYRIIYLNPDEVVYTSLKANVLSGSVLTLVIIAVAVLVLAIGTAIMLSYRKSKINDYKLWNPATRRLIINLAIPLVTGGVFILALFSKGLLGLIAPSTLIFYGLALLNASKFTFEDVKYLGITQIALGLAASYFVGYGLFFWAAGFGLMHIIYGIYMHRRYEK
jgi:NADH:ubiquinone oxidoreductase subunit K